MNESRVSTVIFNSPDVKFYERTIGFHGDTHHVARCSSSKYGYKMSLVGKFGVTTAAKHIYDPEIHKRDCIQAIEYPKL
jgi:hypothetical protein